MIYIPFAGVASGKKVSWALLVVGLMPGAILLA